MVLQSMNITLNGEQKIVPENCTAKQLIESLQLQNTRLALEVNLEIVPRSTFAQRVLRAEDKIEIVRAIGGGQTTQQSIGI